MEKKLSFLRRWDGKGSREDKLISFHWLEMPLVVDLADCDVLRGNSSMSLVELVNRFFYSSYGSYAYTAANKRLNKPLNEESLSWAHYVEYDNPKALVYTSAELSKLGAPGSLPHPRKFIPVTHLDFYGGDLEEAVNPVIVCDGMHAFGLEEKEPEQVTGTRKRKRSTATVRQSNTQKWRNSVKDDGDNTRMAAFHFSESRRRDRKKRCMVNDRTDVPIDDSLQMNHSNRGDDSKELTWSLVSSIAIKRQQNILAARRSCAKKQEHVTSLEQEVNKLMHERDTWKQKAEMSEEELRCATGADAFGG
ncbi:hypothetical protein BT69DRAFT_1372079 [Atractiella rhizophila]|nr:hypothetical protein BT69DRAFT_1372079 [Atractiella rhizophila]